MTDANDINVETTDTATGKRGAPPKVDFDVTTAVDTDGNAVALDDEGKLTGVPANWTHRHEGLKIGHFSDRALFYDFKAFACGLNVAKWEEKAADFAAQAEECRNPDPVKAKQRKLDRMRAMMEKLEAELADEIDDDDE